MKTANFPALIVETATNHGWTLDGATPDASTFTRGDRSIVVVFEGGRVASWKLRRASGTTRTGTYMHQVLDLLAAH